MPDERPTPEEVAKQRAEDWSGLMWHIAAFVIVNIFLWVIVPSAAIWVTLGWGIGLAFHIAAFLIGDNGPSNRRYQKYLAEERARREHEST
jgi:hypothetical protein